MQLRLLEQLQVLVLKRLKRQLRMFQQFLKRLLSKEEAEEIKPQIEDAGASCELK